MRAVINPKPIKAMAGWANNPKDYRRILEGVQISIDENGYRLVTTDSYRLVEVQGERLDEERRGDMRMVFDVRAIAENIKATDNYMLIDTDNMTASLGKSMNPAVAMTDRAEHRVTFSLIEIEGNYPNYEQLFAGFNQEMDMPNGFTVNPIYLMETGKLISDITGKKNASSAPIRIQGTTELKPVYFWTNIPLMKLSVKGIIMPVRMDKKDQFMNFYQTGTSAAA